MGQDYYIGSTFQLSGSTADFLVAVTDFAMGFSDLHPACGVFFVVLCFPQEKEEGF